MNSWYIWWNLFSYDLITLTDLLNTFTNNLAKCFQTMQPINPFRRRSTHMYTFYIYIFLQLPHSLSCMLYTCYIFPLVCYSLGIVLEGRILRSFNSYSLDSTGCRLLFLSEIFYEPRCCNPQPDRHLPNLCLHYSWFFLVEIHRVSQSLAWCDGGRSHAR